MQQESYGEHRDHPFMREINFCAEKTFGWCQGTNPRPPENCVEGGGKEVSPLHAPCMVATDRRARVTWSCCIQWWPQSVCIHQRSCATASLTALPYQGWLVTLYVAWTGRDDVRFDGNVLWPRPDRRPQRRWRPLPGWRIHPPLRFDGILPHDRSLHDLLCPAFALQSKVITILLEETSAAERQWLAAQLDRVRFPLLGKAISNVQYLDGFSPSRCKVVGFWMKSNLAMTSMLVQKHVI